MGVLTLSNGQYKDFTALQVAYEVKHGKDSNSERLFAASVVAGLYNHNAKEQRAMIYRDGSNWLTLIKEAGL
jgi:hypothetical protein